MDLIKVLGTNGTKHLVNKDLIVSAKLDNGKVILNTAGAELILDTDLDRQDMVDYIIKNRIYFMDFTKLGYANTIHTIKKDELEMKLNPNLYSSYNKYVTKYNEVYDKYEELLLELKNKYGFIPDKKLDILMESKLSHFISCHGFFTFMVSSLVLTFIYALCKYYYTN